MFGALADHTRRDIVRRAITDEEGIVELASHYTMSFAAVQKHIAILERAGLITKQRVGRRKVVRTNLEQLRIVRRLLDQYEELWRGRIDRMRELIGETVDALDISTSEPISEPAEALNTAETKESHR
ncbi:MAG: winged helix-turn-helix transcriptional regulator [Chloroflexi bacterium]|nr:winged helix-turn-helix transcriptional regulator [Chloroflexota bacterium]MBV9895317.1 winged helix-turn-helix transcriptional regulator [Chloroflexota bacterium]